MNYTGKFSEKKGNPITCGIYLYNTKNKKILVCHATNSSWNKWSIPKGLKNEGEDPFTAASRELKEETGININDLRILKIHKLPSVKYQKQNKVLESFLILTDTDLDNYRFNCQTLVNNDFPENDAWKWINLHKIKDYLHESQQHNSEKIDHLIKHFDNGVNIYISKKQ